MTGDRWTFLVVRGEDTPVRQYTLSAHGLRVLVGVGVILVLLVTGLALSASADTMARVKNRQLAARNQALSAELEQFRSRVGALEGTVDELSDKDSRIRTIAGLEAIDPEVLQAGVGGPGLGSLEAYPLWSVDSASAKDAYALSYDLAALERRARLLAASLDEASDSLQAHRDLLESTPSILPTSGLLTSRFSKARMHPIHNRPLPHEGIDLVARKGTPIFAAAKGRITRAGWAVGYGLVIEIDHGHGFTTLYGHASKLLVRPGQRVSRGDVIAQVGSTGIATSSHLHYEVSLNGVPQNPSNYILPDIVP
jgi:murein DD-endopeptidase MepM/ murein hydrolase activator NlpD